MVFVVFPDPAASGSCCMHYLLSCMHVSTYKPMYVQLAAFTVYLTSAVDAHASSLVSSTS